MILFDDYRGGNAPELRNRKKYSTVISTSLSDNSVLNSFIGKLLDEFQWTAVFVLYDTNDRIPAFYGVACTELKNFLRRIERKYVVNEASFNSASPGSLTSQIFDRITAGARGIQNVPYICISLRYFSSILMFFQWCLYSRTRLLLVA